jgi:hypothetical protein
MIDYKKVEELRPSVTELISKKIGNVFSLEESDEAFQNIETFLQGLNDLMLEMDDETLEYFIAQIKESISITMDSSTIITEDENSNWFRDTRAERGAQRFNAYEDYLMFTSGYSSQVVGEISNSMDDVMNAIGDPQRKDSFAKKGLVIGDVQSGKTGNFIALMNKAADAGYNMIIVTTGVIEKLRRQTQERIEQGFGGFDANEFVGMKTITSYAKEDIPSFMATTKNSDFKKNINFKAMLNDHVPIVAVIKKEKTALESMASWLEKQYGDQINHSLLFIDDEADNATVNTKKKDSPTVINNGIRTILNLFMRSSYVGFTATPFANVFIDHEVEDDLFPSDFIQVLDTPSNYMGAEAIFPEEAKYHRILVSNDDAEEYIPIKIPKEQRKSFVVEGLPESLKQAIKVFFLQNAIRDLRGDENKHRSMLINVSYLNYIQEQVRRLVLDLTTSLKREIKNYILIDEAQITIEFKSLFDEMFHGIPEEWKQVQKTLYKSTDAIITEVINAGSKSFQYEDYPNGARVIAIGGFALSRGLTLEGLSTSYLYRNTMMYDTLMQMGRWFGYRPKYDDLVYLYMPNQSIDWYAQILDATINLKQQLKQMANEHKKPKDFGLFVKEANTDEVTLLITSPVKMRNASKSTFPIRISGAVKETTKLEKGSLKRNIEAVESWIETHEKQFDETLLWKSADIRVVKDLVESYSFGVYNQLNSSIFNVVLNQFDKMDIKIISNQKGQNPHKIGSITVNPRQRSSSYRPEEQVVALGNSRLGTMDDGRYGLTQEQLDVLQTGDISKEVDYFLKFNDKQRLPILMIYPLFVTKSSSQKVQNDKVDDFFEAYGEIVVYGMALGVPTSTTSEPLSYQIKMNSVLQQQLINSEKMKFDDDELEDELDGN